MDEVFKGMVFYKFHSALVAMERSQQSNQNTYNLRSRKEPLMDGIPLALQPNPPNPRASNNSTPIRPAYGGQQNHNQVNVPTILKNPAWSTEKYNVVEELK